MVLIALTVSFCTFSFNQSGAEERQQLLQLARSGLMDLSLALTMVTAQQQSLEMICVPPQGTQEAIVPAREILFPLFEKNGFPNPGDYFSPPKLIKGGAKDPIFMLWVVVQNRRGYAKEFLWKNQEGLSLAFPLIWTKNPEVFGKKVALLTINGMVEIVDQSDFENYIATARQWIYPENIDPNIARSMVKSSDPSKRWQGIRLLGISKAKNDLPLIAASLKDSDGGVQIAAIWAIGAIGDASGVAHLEAFAKSNFSGERMGTASSLGKIKGPASCKLLCEILRDKDPLVRKEAVLALPGTEEKECISSLIPMLNDEDLDVRQSALEALRLLGWQPPNK
ncbi:conserved hypothetical protein, secreted [sediment metagenome]|uniref:HEAT repeat domain-containing protein n=1 Tax=sediment metagenome TaxID=749907 RepID=D9PKT8_9ZZZZ